MIDEARHAIAQTPVHWDDVRERRVLTAVERRLEARAQARARNRRIAGWSGGLTAAAAAVALGVFGLVSAGTPEPRSDRMQAATQALQDLEVTEPGPGTNDTVGSDAPTMAFADGSVARLRDDARIDIEVQTDDLVRLEQSSGTVRYEVTPNPARRFVVDAAGVEVRVIGTVFTVTVGGEAVAVAVERGRVAVEGSDRVAELGAGDQLTVGRSGSVAGELGSSREVAPDEIVVLAEDDGPQPESDRRAPRPPRPAPAPSVGELLERADAARAGGRLDDAASALSELVRRHSRDPRAYSAYFQLGKVERSRGHHGAAASAFAACYKRAPDGALSEDARAEAAVSWLDAGQNARATKTAQDYLEQHPGGAHVARMKRILQRAK